MDGSDYEEPAACTSSTGIEWHNQQRRLTAAGPGIVSAADRRRLAATASHFALRSASDTSNSSSCFPGATEARRSLLDPAAIGRMPVPSGGGGLPPPQRPGNSPSSLLLCSSGSMSAYATSSLLRSTNPNPNHRLPPTPPSFPPPRRRTAQQQQQQQKRRRQCAAGTGWGRCWMAGLVLLLITLLALAFLLWLTGFRSLGGQQQPATSSQQFPSNSISSSSSASASDYRISFASTTGASSSSASSAIGLPDGQLPLGRPIRLQLPAHHLLFGRLALVRDSLLWLNFTLSPRARIVLWARQSQRPSPGQFDWQRILTGANLHLVKREGEHRRLAVVSHFLQAGQWHFGFLNDRTETESLTLLAQTGEGASGGGGLGERHSDCQFDCFGKGECREGRCVCHPGYGGPFCEETACPVLCSGQGVFSAGRCHCHEGFRGVECELPAGWCSDCSGHGRCQPGDGSCQCEPGWTGEDCGVQQKQSQCAADCSQHGVCVDRRCFCEPGWTGWNCGWRVAELAVKNEVPECSRNCSGQGRCQPDGNCECQTGWTGLDCALPDCPFGCELHGHCSSLAMPMRSRQCQCDPGWTGKNCQIELCAHNCSGAGQCSLGEQGWRCDCNGGHFGEKCEFRWETSCEDGVDNDGDGLTDCEDSTECCSHPTCSADALCLGPLLSREVAPTTGQQPSTAASFADRMRFLFDGGHLSVQRYADTRLLHPKRLSVLRGRVLSEAGGPLVGVRVSEARHPQQGFSLSRAGLQDSIGEFELAVNGGGPVTLQFVRQPYGRILRTFHVPWNQIVHIGPVWVDLPPVEPDFGNAQSNNNNNNNGGGCLRALGQLKFRPLLLQSRPSTLPPPDCSPASGPAARLALDSLVLSLAVPVSASFAGLCLLYSTDRAKGSRSHLRIQLLDEQVPRALLKVHVQLEIGGRRMSQWLAPEPSLEFQFDWDRENAFWQREAGLVPGEVTISLHFADCALPIRQRLPFRLAASPRTSWALPSPLWSLSWVHRLQLELAAVERGDGQVQYLDDGQWILRTVLGTGNDQCPLREECPGINVRLTQPMALAAGPDGSTFLGDGQMLLRLAPDGQSVDGIFQLDVKDSAHPYFLAIDPAGTALHVSLPLQRQIWRIPIGKDAGGHHHDVLADEQKSGLTFPKGIVFDLDGNLLVADGRRLLQLNAEGAVQRVLLADGGWRPLRGCARLAPLADLSLEWPTALTLDPVSGQIFLLDADSVIFRLDLRLGVVFVLAGFQRGCESGGYAAPPPIQAIAFCPRWGRLFLAQADGKRHNWVKFMEDAANQPTGPLQTLIGNAQQQQNCDCDPIHCACDDPELLMPAAQARLHWPRALAVLPGGDLLIADQGSAKLKRLQKPAPEWEGDLFRVNNPASDEQFEFDAQGRHTRTRSLRTGLPLREMEYGADGQLLAIRRGHRELRVQRAADGGWTLVDERGRQVLRAEPEPGEQPELIRRINGSTFSAGTLLMDYGPGQLLHSAVTDQESAFFRYDPSSGLPSSAWFSDGGGEWTLEGPKLKGNGRWLTQLRGTRDTGWELEQKVAEDSDGRGELELRHKNGQTILALSAPSQQQQQLSLPELSLRWQFDWQTNALLNRWEWSLFRQRLSLKQGPAGAVRAEWRNQVRNNRAEDNGGGGGRGVQLNGRNLFSVDFDRSKITDSLLDPFEHRLLGIDYSADGHLKSVNWPNGAQLRVDAESLGPEAELVESRVLSVGEWTWRRRMDAEGRPLGWAAQRTSEQREAMWRRLVLSASADGEQQLKLLLPSGAAFVWTSPFPGRVLRLVTPSGERHSLIRSLPPLFMTANFTRLGLHSIRGEKDEQQRLRWVEGRQGSNNQQWTLKRTAANWLQREMDSRGRVVSHRQATNGMDVNLDHDSMGRLISAKSELFHRRLNFLGPLSREANCSVAQAPTQLFPGFLFNWTSGDQLFRPAAIGVQFTSPSPEWTKFEWNGGQKRREGQVNFEQINNRLTAGIGQICRIEFHLDELGRTQSRRLFFPANAPEPTVVVSFGFGATGGWSSENWTVEEGGRQWSGQREFSEDGQVISLRVGSASKEWRLGYDSDLRPNRLNGVQLRLGIGGVALRFGQLLYETEAESGWVRKRGGSTFHYDGLGQVVAHDSADGHRVDYFYDDLGRLVARKAGRDGWQTFSYGDPLKPLLLTHFVNSPDASLLWRLHWTPQDEPFLLESSSGEKFLLVPDADKSIRLVLDSSGSIVDEFFYSLTGERFSISTVGHRKKSAVSPPLPIGFRAQLYDAETQLLLFSPSASLPASRPLDTFIGRFMSHHFDESEIGFDWLRPEMLADPFGLWEATTPVDGDQMLLRTFDQLLPKPAFMADNPPFGLPIREILPTGFGLSALEELEKEMITAERIPSLPLETHGRAETNSWMGALSQKEPDGNSIPILAVRNGTGISFKFVYPMDARLQPLLAELLDQIEVAEENIEWEDLLGEAEAGMPVVHLMKSREEVSFENDATSVENYYRKMAEEGKSNSQPQPIGIDRTRKMIWIRTCWSLITIRYL